MTSVKVEEDIVIVNDLTDEPVMVLDKDGNKVPEKYSHYNFLCLIILADPKIGEGKKGAKIAKRIKKVFKGAKPGDWVNLDDEDVEAVLRVMESPTNKWNQVITSQLLPFIEAFEKENRDKNK